MSEGKLLKPDQDFSAIVEAELPAISQLPLQQALERLSVLEKQTRQASDAVSTKRILVKAVQLCAESNDWDVLNDQLLAFSKKHGQLKAAAQGMVAECWNLLRSKNWEQEGKVDKRNNLIETLRVITEGKVFPCFIVVMLTIGICGGREGSSDEIFISDFGEFDSS